MNNKPLVVHLSCGSVQATDDQLQSAAYQGRESRLSHQQIFKQWMTDYEKLIRHLVSGFESTPAIQDELFQEIALHIWQALPGFRGQASPKTFIARIAHNKLATHVDKAVRQGKSVGLEAVAEMDDGQHTPYQQLAADKRQQKLAVAIRQLKLEQRQVITLALEGMSYEEMADALNISTNLVGVRLNRAKAALKKLLEF